MLKKAIAYFTIACAIILFFTTCKKYPEGGWSNMALKHLFGGLDNGASKIWQLSLYEVNGIDSTKYIIPNNGVTNFENDNVQFLLHSKKDAKYEIGLRYQRLNFDLSKDKRLMTINKNEYGNVCSGNSCERNIFAPDIISTGYIEWKIIKLKKNELIIMSTIKNNNYKIILTV